jgi:hypothetical protein
VRSKRGTSWNLKRNQGRESCNTCALHKADLFFASLPFFPWFFKCENTNLHRVSSNQIRPFWPLTPSLANPSAVSLYCCTM